MAQEELCLPPQPPGKLAEETRSFTLLQQGSSADLPPSCNLPWPLGWGQ